MPAQRIPAIAEEPAADHAVESGQPDWSKLPDELLQRCLSCLGGGEQQWPLSLVCRAFARAVLVNSLRVGQSSVRLRLNVTREPSSFARVARCLARILEEPPLEEEGEEPTPTQKRFVHGEGLTLVLFSSYTRSSPDKCLAQLCASGVRLTRVSRLELEYLLLDSLAPSGPAALSTLLPNLRELCLLRCQFTTTPSAVPPPAPPPPRASLLPSSPSRRSDGGAMQLLDKVRHFQVVGLAPCSHQTMEEQFRQLEGLPALTSISLLDDSCPTDFLVTLHAAKTNTNTTTTTTANTTSTGRSGTNEVVVNGNGNGSGHGEGGNSNHITSLQLDRSNRRCLPGVPGGTPSLSPRWEATLRHVAACTRLRSLTIPCATSGELQVVTSALTGLQRLNLECPALVNGELDGNHLGGGAAGAAAGGGLEGEGDAMVELLLGLTSLVSLRWEDCSLYRFQRSHAGRAARCGWREVAFGRVGPHQLARLPLSGLAAPATWAALVVDARTSVEELQEAAANTTITTIAAASENMASASAGGAAGSGGDALAAAPAAPTAATAGSVVAAPWSSLWFAPPPAEAGTFLGGPGRGDTPAALLRACGPLLARAPGALVQGLTISHLAWDRGSVEALGAVLPAAACQRLTLEGGRVEDEGCAQVARSLPWLRALSLVNVVVRPASVAQYLAEVRAGGLALRSLRVQPAWAGAPGGEGWAAVTAQAADHRAGGVEVEVHL